LTFSLTFDIIYIMNILSLFDGISCGKVALERAGVPITEYYASEIDQHAITISQRHHPEIKQIGNVLNVDYSRLPKIDLLIGGSPCQGFSNAGSGLAFEDSRSKLFFEFVQALVDLEPTYFLLENVKMKQEWVDIITEYVEVAPILINSSLVSGQNRERYYWTNIPNVGPPVTKRIILKDILEENPSLIYDPTQKALDKYDGGRYLNPAYRGQGNRIHDINKPSPTLCAGSHGYANGYIQYNGRLRKLTPIECERLQTLPDNYTDGVSDTQRYKALGNGWTVDVAAHIFKHI
jgi:site-specific DNA-cytosine methylase